MDKNYIFYRCYLERCMAGGDEPGLLAATEVVRTVCDAGFQRDGLLMKCYPSSPHCYYKYAKAPKNGMFMLRAVKKTDMTTLDILIDTRLYPSFVMIEKQQEWQAEAAEVKDTLELVINNDADKYNWHINMQEHTTNTTQNLDEFISALSYMKDQEDEHDKYNSNVQIGQLILKVNGNNYYSDDIYKVKPTDAENSSEELQPRDDDLVQELKPLFYNNEADVRQFLNEIEGMQPNDITDLVNRWVQEKRIAAVIGFRCGVVFMLLAGKETNACVEFALLMADYTLEMQLANFGPTLRKQYARDSEEPVRYAPNRVAFNELPQSFVLSDLRALKGPELSDAGLYSIIRRWTVEGWIERKGKCWTKVTKE